jgi:CBS domain-containing membrane protein
MTTSPSGTAPERAGLFRRAKLFSPILPGATFYDRVLACFGALIGIGLTALLCGLTFNGVHVPVTPLLVAPMGASAVLLYAVPASPLAQPWSIIGGNTISALVGITVVHFVPDVTLAAGLGVAGAIAAMSLFRCLHPPGGAAALTAVLGGPTVFALGYKFALVPVGFNSALLVFCGFLFHRLSRRHVYPHVASRALAAETPSPDRLGFRAADIDKAIEELGETLDVDRGDIDLLLRRVELHALSRAHGHLTCEDIMSRNVNCISWDTSPDAAQRLLLAHSQPILPIIDDREKVIGCVSLSELLRFGGHITTLMSEAATAQRDTPVVDLIDKFVDSNLLGVVIVDEQRRLKGLVTQANLLEALSRGGNALH